MELGSVTLKINNQQRESGRGITGGGSGYIALLAHVELRNEFSVYGIELG